MRCEAAEIGDVAASSTIQSLGAEIGECLTQLTIAPGANLLTIVDGCGRARAFDTSGRKQTMTIGAGVAEVRTEFRDGHLVQHVYRDRRAVLMVYSGCRDELVLTVATEPLGSKAVACSTYVFDSDRLR